MTHAEIVAAKGAKAIADRIGVQAGRVRTWRCRNIIPRVVWPELVEAYPDITLAVLKAGEASNDGSSQSRAA